jgi:hypothetical protein
VPAPHITSSPIHPALRLVPAIDEVVAVRRRALGQEPCSRDPEANAYVRGKVNPCPSAPVINYPHPAAAEQCREGNGPSASLVSRHGRVKPAPARSVIEAGVDGVNTAMNT